MLIEIPLSTLYKVLQYIYVCISIYRIHYFSDYVYGIYITNTFSFMHIVSGNKQESGME